MRVLPGNGIRDGFFQGSDSVPFIRRPDAAVAADLIDAPVDFHGMIVGVAELYGDLAASAAASLEVDLRAMGAQPVARANDLGEGRDFESKVMQFFVLGSPVRGAHQR